MATQVEKLQKVKEIKTSIKDVINANGGNVGETFSEYPLAIETLLTGGGSDSPKGQYRIRYFDIDGTVLKEEWLDSGATLTPPKAPNYDPDYLVFDSWNYDVANTVVNSSLDIGAIYNTIDNCTYMFCRFTTNTGLNPTLAIGGSPTIDWGDGTVDTNKSHTYASEGEYVIKITGRLSVNTSSSTYLLGSSNLNEALQKAYLGNVTSIGGYGFSNCRSLQNINIPNSVKEIDTSLFYNCTSIRNINIPNGATSIGRSGSNVFSSCYSLKSVSIPNSVINITSYSFSSCHSLQNIVIPNSLKVIGNGVFNCYSITNYFILCNQVPTLNSNVFGSINKSCIMWVNDEIYKELQTATNWSTYASYMKRLSEYRGDYYD